MDKKVILSKVRKRNGWVSIKGYALNRAIIVESQLLRDDYQWGYRSQKSTVLAKDILSIFTNISISNKVAINFSQGIITQLPEANFDVLININKILDILLGGATDKKIHSHQLIKVQIGKTYYPKLLDFVSMPYKTCVFKWNTIEYDLLNNMTEKELTELKQHTSKQSKRLETDEQGEVSNVCTQFLGLIDIEPQSSAYVVRNGLGTGVNNGLNKTDYGRID